MNKYIGIGRLTKDPEAMKNGTGCRFTIACDRGKDKDGNDAGADFVPITVFGKQAENCMKYLSKGRMVAVEGKYRSNSYQGQDGKMVYSQNIVAQFVQFLEWGDKNASAAPAQPAAQPAQPEAMAGFTQVDDEIPF